VRAAEVIKHLEQVDPDSPLVVRLSESDDGAVEPEVLALDQDARAGNVVLRVRAGEAERNRLRRPRREEEDLAEYPGTVITGPSLSEIAARERAVHAGEVAWGPWRYDPENLRLESVRPGSGGCKLELRRYGTCSAMLDVICQVATKDWADAWTLGWLVRALDELLSPQKNLCSFGHDIGPLDVEQHLTRPSVGPLGTQGS
jgi:hypothetical protein